MMELLSPQRTPITQSEYFFYEPFGLTHTLRGHVRSPISLQFHPTVRSILASGCLAGQVYLWNLNSMVGVRMYQLCPFRQEPTTSHRMIHSVHAVLNLPVGSIAFHPDGKHLVASRSRQLTLWNIKSQEPLHTVFTAHESERIRGVMFDPYGRYMVTAIRRIVPAPAVTAPSIHLETTWQPKRPKTWTRLSHVREALNKLIYAGQKRPASSSPSSSGSASVMDGLAGPSGVGSERSPAAGHHSPQPRLSAPEEGGRSTRTRPCRVRTSRVTTSGEEGESSNRAVTSPSRSQAQNNQPAAVVAAPASPPTGGDVQRARNLCTECQAGQLNKNVVQLWEWEEWGEGMLPDITDVDHNVISSSAITVTNVNIQVSRDGSFVCLVEKETCEDGGSPLYLTVYSLSPDTFRQCLMRTSVKYIPMCISVTPCNQYIVTFARHNVQDNHGGMIITYEIPKKRVSEKQRITRSMTKPPSCAPKFNRISIHDESPINIARFGHLPWQGTVIGTCSGKLYLMRVAPKQTASDTLVAPQFSPARSEEDGPIER